MADQRKSPFSWLRRTFSARSPQSQLEGGEKRALEDRYATIYKVTAGAGVLAAIFYVAFYLATDVWQVLGAGGLTIFGLLVLLIGYVPARRGRFEISISLFLFAVALVYGGFGFFFERATTYLFFGGGTIILLIGAIVIPRRWYIWGAAFGLITLLLWSAEAYLLIPRHNIQETPALQVFIPVVTLGVSILAFGIALRSLLSGNIRTRLLASFLTLSVVPLAIVGALVGITTERNVIQQVTAQLNSVATLKTGEITDWVTNLQDNLALTVVGETNEERIDLLLTAEDVASLSYEDASGAMRNRFRDTLNTTQLFTEIFLIDQNGRVILSTERLQEGKFVDNKRYWEEALTGANYVQSPTYFPATGSTTVVAVRPVFNEEEEVIGAVAGRADMLQLNEIMSERSGLGESGETYLVGQSRALLTASQYEAFGADTTFVRTEAADLVFNENEGGTGDYVSYHGEDVLGVYRWIPELQVGLFAEQGRREALAISGETIQIVVLVLLVTAAIAVASAYTITRSVAEPLTNLTQTATQIADGRLDLRAEMDQEDEVGVLADAFNRMTAQIQELVNTLEQRVQDRTRALATSTEVGRRLSTILEQEALMKEVVEEVQSAFGYYHVHIYLFGDDGEALQMMAGTGEAGRQMLADDHQIPYGEGLVGRAAKENRIVLVPDVSQAPDWLPNPLLPDTRAEAAVPISSGEAVLGVLDVQDDMIGSLEDVDVEALQSIANQVAIALQNARLYEEIEHRAQREARINEISRRILSTGDMQSAMQVAIRELGRASGAEKTRVRLTTLPDDEENGRHAS